MLSAHPIIGPGRNQVAPQKAKLAMAVRGNENDYLIGQIRRRHWLAQGRQVGLSTQSVEALIHELIAATDLVLSKVAASLPASDDEPVNPGTAHDLIFARAARRLDALWR